MLVATGIREEDKNLNKGNIFILMATIGNVQKLKTWDEMDGGKFFNDLKEKALIKAAENGQLACMMHLIETSEQVIPIAIKALALSEAAKNGHLACMAYLIEKGGSDISEGLLALVQAAEGGHLACVKYLIKKCGPEILSIDVGTSFWRASNYGQLACMKYLIKKGSTHFSEGAKNLAFELAAQNGHLDCAEYVLEKYGRDISIKSKESALQGAKCKNHKEAIAYLEQHLHSISAASIDTPLTSTPIYTPAATQNKKTKREEDNHDMDEKETPKGQRRFNS